MSAPAWKHPNDMDRDELREVVGALSGMALDLAQHLSFTNDMLRVELREDAYKKAERMAYAISHFPYHGPEGEMERSPGLAVFGESGLEKWTT